MATSILDVLEAVRAKIASLAGVAVGLGAPADSQPGLFILPYNFSEDQAVHNRPLNLTNTQTDRSFVVQCLLVPSPPNSYAEIGEGLSSLTEQPIIVLGESRVSVNTSQLSVDELTQIFISAGIAYRLAIPFELRWRSGR